MCKKEERFRSEITGIKIPSTNRIDQIQSRITGGTFKNLPGMSAGIWFEEKARKLQSNNKPSK